MNVDRHHDEVETTIRPQDTAAPFPYGRVRCIHLQYNSGTSFHPYEMKLLKTGVSVITSENSIICICNTILEPCQKPSLHLSAPFTILTEPDQLVDITLPIINRTSKLRRIQDNSYNYINLIIFGMPLIHQPFISIYLFLRSGSRPPPHKTAITCPAQATFDEVPAGRSLKLICKKMKWKPSPSCIFGDFETCITFEAHRQQFSRHNSAKLNSVSDPAVRLDRIERMSESSTIFVFLTYDSTLTQPPGSAPPNNLVLQLFLCSNSSGLVLRRNPEPVMSPLSKNGLCVYSPYDISLSAGQTTQITFNNAYESGDSLWSLFFPNARRGIQANLCQWIQRKDLTVTISAILDTDIKKGDEIGRIHWFPTYLRNDEFVERLIPEMNIPQYEAYAYCETNDIEDALEDFHLSEDDSEESQPIQTPNVTETEQCGTVDAPDSDEESTNLHQMSLSNQRQTDETLPSQVLYDNELENFIFDETDNIQVNLDSEDEIPDLNVREEHYHVLNRTDMEEYLLDTKILIESNGPKIPIIHLNDIMFTLHSNQLTETTVFFGSGVKQDMVFFRNLKGRFNHPDASLRPKQVKIQTVMTTEQQTPARRTSFSDVTLI